MTASTHPSTKLNLKALEAKVTAVQRALVKRFESKFSEGEIDYLTGLYTLGLTTPFFEKTKMPEEHLEACRTLLLNSQTAYRANQALDFIPDNGDAEFIKLENSIEGLGLKDGAQLLNQSSGEEKTTSPSSQPIPSTASADQDNKNTSTGA